MMLQVQHAQPSSTSYCRQPAGTIQCKNPTHSCALLLLVGARANPAEDVHRLACCRGFKISMISLKEGRLAGSAQVRSMRAAMGGARVGGSASRAFAQPTAPTTCTW